MPAQAGMTFPLIMTLVPDRRNRHLAGQSHRDGDRGNGEDGRRYCLGHKPRRGSGQRYRNSLISGDTRQRESRYAILVGRRRTIAAP
jgi:hypothetical protein